jgi:hypothetical protein
MCLPTRPFRASSCLSRDLPPFFLEKQAGPALPPEPRATTVGKPRLTLWVAVDLFRSSLSVGDPFASETLRKPKQTHGSGLALEH